LSLKRGCDIPELEASMKTSFGKTQLQQASLCVRGVHIWGCRGVLAENSASLYKQEAQEVPCGRELGEVIIRPPSSVPWGGV
jgi:hypothetical protein